MRRNRNHLDHQSDDDQFGICSRNRWSIKYNASTIALASAIALVVWSLWPGSAVAQVPIWTPAWRYIVRAAAVFGFVFVHYAVEVHESPLAGLWTAVFIDAHTERPAFDAISSHPWVVAFTGWLLLFGTPLLIYVLASVGEFQAANNGAP